MLKYLTICNLILGCLSTTLGQNNISGSLLVDSTECCKAARYQLDNSINHDTTKFKYYIYRMICNNEKTSNHYFSLIDSFIRLEEKFKYSGTSSEDWKFKGKHRGNITFAKRKFYKTAIDLAIHENNYLLASIYANRLSRCYLPFKYWRTKSKWKDLSLKYYQKHADLDYLKLLRYHDGNLLWKKFSVRQFDGYDHLIKTISTTHSKSEFAALLEEGIKNSYITSEVIRGRPHQSINFKIQDSIFSYYDEDISKLYLPDTVLVDTFVVFNCYGNDPRGSEYIEIVRDTITNKISSFNELSEYQSLLRQSTFWGILDDLIE